MNNKIIIGNKQVEVFKYLEKFKSHYFLWRFRRFFYGSNIFEQDIDKAIEVLSGFFPTEYFDIIKQPIRQNLDTYKPERNWLVHHLAQSENNFGSFMLILEIANIIDFYFKQEKLNVILHNKLKYNKLINDRGLVGSLFELYVGMRLIEMGFSIEQEASVPGDIDCKPIDLIVNISNERYLIELTRLNQSEGLDSIVSTFYDLASAPIRIKPKNNVQYGRNINLCGFIKFGNTKMTSKEVNALRITLNEKLKYFDPSEAIENNSYESNSIVIENYDKEKIDFYKEILKTMRYSIIFKIHGKKKDGFITYNLILELSIGKNDWEEKLLNALKHKQKQHKSSVLKNKIFVIEVDNYLGWNIQFDVNKINKSRFDNIIKENETLIIIEKNSKPNNIYRRALLIGQKNIEIDKIIRGLVEGVSYTFGRASSLISY